MPRNIADDGFKDALPHIQQGGCFLALRRFIMKSLREDKLRRVKDEAKHKEERMGYNLVIVREHFLIEYS